MKVTINLNEQTLEKIIASFGKALAPQPSQHLEALQKQVASLQKELAQVKAQASANKAEPIATQKTVSPLQSAQPAKQLAPQSAQPTKQDSPSEAQSQLSSGVPCQAKPNGNGKYASPDTLKAEQWAQEHLAEWLDQPCPFAKAQGRTWRQLAENFGEKIVIKGKPMPPRAYLHVLEGWEDCTVWARTKAKVTLQVIPSKNGNESKA